MDRGNGTLIGFLPLLILGVVAVIVLRLVFGSAPAEAEEPPVPPSPRSASVYTPLGVEPGHRQDCEGPGASLDGPVRTEAPPLQIVCNLDPAPKTIRALVTYDVDPQGRAVNIVTEGEVPLCIERPIERAVGAWRYCPYMVHGDAQWRYGETVILSFSRRD